MFFYPFKILLAVFLLTGTGLTLTATSWLSAWIGLEINLMAFVPLASLQQSKIHASPFKYFLVQALASLLLLWAFSMIYLFSPSYPSLEGGTMMFLTLMLKLGAAPLHFWLPSVMNGLTWELNLILATWQKLGPFILVASLHPHPNSIFYIFITGSALFGGVGGINQSSLRSLLAFSSINHMGWMITILHLNINLFNFYFFVYTLTNLVLMLLFSNLRVYFLTQMLGVPDRQTTSPLIFLNLLSLGGLPPFLGFAPKWMSILLLLEHKMYVLTTILVMSSLLTLYFYLRIVYCIFMLTFSRVNWKIFYPYLNNPVTMSLFFSSFIFLGMALLPLLNLL